MFQLPRTLGGQYSIHIPNNDNNSLFVGRTAWNCFCKIGCRTLPEERGFISILKKCHNSYASFRKKPGNWSRASERSHHAALLARQADFMHSSVAYPSALHCCTYAGYRLGSSCHANCALPMTCAMLDAHWELWLQSKGERCIAQHWRI